MKRIGLAILFLLLVLAAVLAWRSAMLESRQAAAESAAPAELEARAAARRLAEALTYRTISHADQAQHETEPFAAFRRFLDDRFPAVHRSLRRESVGKHSLLYTWPGSEPDRNPVLLMAHYDVVPVERGTDAEWTHPPFAGEIADGYVWGRGALDNKSGVLGILEAVSLLLADGYRPKRSVLLAFGHDEEIGGQDGAKQIAGLLQERGIRPAWVLDEGGLIVPDNAMAERPLALVGTAEKGYLSLRLTVRGAGGHSSQPPPQTAVGVLAAAIDRLQESPFPARLVAPTSDMFDTVAPHMSPVRQVLFANRWLFEPLILKVLSGDRLTNAMIRTTTAPTMLRGADKDNLLPLVAEGVVNFRLLPGDSVESVTARVAEVIDDERVSIERVGGFAIGPSPVSPTDGPAFETLARTIRSLHPDSVVAPYLVVGATDSRHFIPVSERIYRFLPFVVPTADIDGLHGTNERIAMETYADGIRFYRLLLLSATR